VLPTELIPPEVTAIFRVAPDCSTAASTVLETLSTGQHPIVPGSGERISDGGELAIRGVAARAALNEYLFEARRTGVVVFENRGQIRLQRAIDRFGKADATEMTFQPTCLANWEALVNEQARVLTSDAVRAVLTKTGTDAGGQGLSTSSDAQKWALMDIAASTVAHDFRTALERALWHSSDLAGERVCATSLELCTNGGSAHAKNEEAPASLLQLTQMVVVAEGLRSAGLHLREDMWGACTPHEIRCGEIGEYSVTHFFQTIGTHTPPVGHFLDIADAYTRPGEIQSTLLAARLSAGKQDYFEYASRYGVGEDLTTLLRVGTYVGGASAVIGLLAYRHAFSE
jgi:hypothetical protein